MSFSKRLNLNRLITCIVTLFALNAQAQTVNKELSPFDIPAPQSLTVVWDCFLPSDFYAATCTDLQRGYFNGLGNLTAPHDGNGEADLKVVTRAIIRLDGVIELTFNFIGKKPFPVFDFKRLLSAQLSSNEQYQLIIAALHKGTAPFLPIKSPAEADSKGDVVMNFGQSGSGGGIRPDQGNTNWYVSPSISGYLQTGDTSIYQGSASASAAYSTPLLQFQSSASVSYQKISIDYPGSPAISAETFNYGMDVLTAYSFTDRWSVAGFANISHTPAQNLRLGKSGGVGVEWNLVPFLRSNENTVIVRYKFAYNDQAYDRENKNLNLNQQYFTHFLSVYLNWHFDQVDLNAGISGSSNADQLRYSSALGSLGGTYRITDNLNFTLTFRVNFLNESLAEPLSRDTANPLEQYVVGGNFAKVSVTTLIGLSYTFGNALLNRQDQRWK